jgi:hypothetical protein
MSNWYDQPAMGWVLRLGGLALLGISAASVLTLYRMVHAGAMHQATPIELLLALVGFLAASGGSMATVLGRHLFDLVQVSSRWSRST